MDRLILNCDLGEDEPLELTEHLLKLVDAVNIGCGFHAGDLGKTRATIERAHEAGVRIGAHPGLPAEGGRGGALPSAHAFRQLLDTQVGSFEAAAGSVGARMDYIKLHGTLYHAVEVDPALAQAYLDFLNSLTLVPAIFALAGGSFSQAAVAQGFKVYREAFADRAYRQDGSLVPRTEPHSVLPAAEALERFRRWREQGSLPTLDGGDLALQADTFCVHGDSPDALEMIRTLREMLGEA